MDRGQGAVARIAKAILWWGLGALMLAILGGYFGSAVVRDVYPPYVAVEGISMEPLLHVGDLVMLQHATVQKLKKGDIIAFQTTKTVQQKYDVPAHFVHKIYKVVHESNGQLEFQTKGIHNPSPDGFLTPSSMVIGRYAGYIPYAGYVVLFVQSSEGMILGGAIVAVIAIYILLGYLDERKAERQQLTVGVAEALGEMRAMVEGAVQTVTPANAAHGPPGEPIAGAGRTLRDDRLEVLVGAVAEYGEHLQSHTAVMRHLATTTDRLESATEGLLEVVARMRASGHGAVPENPDAPVGRADEPPVDSPATETSSTTTSSTTTSSPETSPPERAPAQPVAPLPAPSPSLPPVWEVEPLPARRTRTLEG